MSGEKKLLQLPNDGWRKVSLRILIALLRCGLVRVAEEEICE
jgi:hypothetical protein